MSYILDALVDAEKSRGQANIFSPFSGPGKAPQPQPHRHWLSWAAAGLAAVLFFAVGWHAPTLMTRIEAPPPLAPTPTPAPAPATGLAAEPTPTPLATAQEVAVATPVAVPPPGEPFEPHRKTAAKAANPHRARQGGDNTLPSNAELAEFKRRLLSQPAYESTPRPAPDESAPTGAAGASEQGEGAGKLLPAHPEPSGEKASAPDFEAHLYSPSPRERIVRLNGKSLQEGAEVLPQLVLHEITPDGAVFEYQGRRFFKSATQGKKP